MTIGWHARRRPPPASANSAPPLPSLPLQWLIADGKLSTEGEAWAVPVKVAAQDQADEVMDGAGNIIQIKREQKLSKQDLKRKMKDKAKLRKERLKRGESVDDLSDDDEGAE